MRHLGGALARKPRHPNAIDHRSAHYGLNLVTAIDNREAAHRARAIHSTVLSEWSDASIGAWPNFSFGLPSHQVARVAFRDATYARLAQIKTALDPAGMLRSNITFAT